MSTATKSISSSCSKRARANRTLVSMSFTRPYVLRISARMATSPNQQGGVGAASGAIWMWTEACVILRGYSPFKMTFCLVDLLRRHLFLSFYNASPLLSTFFLISPAYWYLVAQLVGSGSVL